MYSVYPLLLSNLFFIFIFSFYFQSRSLLLPKNAILPLRIQSIQPGSLTKPPKKLYFNHNISLTVTLTVGSPPQPVTMVLDTGSELSYLHCNKTPTTPLSYDALHSTSYTPIPCTSPVCKTRTRDFTLPVSCDQKKLCHVILSYADATSVEGNLAYDTFRFTDSVLPGVIFGCMDTGSSSNQEEDSKSTGLMGLNRGSLSFVTQMGYPKFSYCISGQDSTGVLMFGEFNTTWLKPLSYTPMVNISTPLPYFDRVAYTVQLEGIKVAGTVLPLPKSVYEPDHTGAGQTMIDSGTQFTFLLGPVYTALKNEFLKQTKNVLRVYEDLNFVFQGAMDLCYRVERSRVGLPVLPNVSMMFRGSEMVVSGQKLLFKVGGLTKGSDDVYCFTFGNSDLLGIEAYVIGHHHQQNMWMEFDLVNNRVGFAEISCDSATQKLGIDS
ncbi:aspartic proteinase PCS1-like [Rutidosis leptorrhynchoides]|uniref:aspartic proteinase PCS1-like n=1 Tax=Rutidosis leptorrhynchoides TaxID=125765 RepID=UPI003A99F4EE